MTTLSVTFSSAVKAPADLRYQVERFTKHIYGGCKDAEIAVYGRASQQDQLESLVKQLGAAVMVMDEAGAERWWGFVSEVQLSIHGFTFGVSLDSMWNRVGIAHTDDFGSRQDSAWVEDGASIARWGMKEQRLSVAGIDAASATTRAASALAVTKTPQGVMSFERTDEREQISARIFCRGWWSRTNWRYYQTSAGIHEHLTTSNIGQYFGEGFDINRVAQWVSAYGPIPYTHIELPVQKFGSPGDNLVAEIREGSETGTLLASATYTPSMVPSAAPKYVRAALSSPLLQAADWYIVLLKDGASSGTHFYSVNIDTTLSYSSTNGIKVRKVSTWQSTGIPVAGNMNFRLIANEPTTDQIVRAITVEAGDLFAAVDVEAASDTDTPAVSSGDYRLGDEVERLLETSQHAGASLAATVTPNKRVRIRPVFQSQAYTIDETGTIRNQFGTQVRRVECPVGVYIKPLGLFKTLDASVYLGSAALVVIESAEYTARYDRNGNIVEEFYRFIPRGSRDPFSTDLSQG